MKYDFLKDFKQFLNLRFNKNTADRYYYAVDKVFKDIQFNSIEEIDVDFVYAELNKTRTKNDFSAVKNGLKQFQKLYPTFGLPPETYFKSESAKRKNHRKKVKSPLFADEINHKINGLHNDKFKLAYRLMLKSGLRVSETAALCKSDIEIDGGEIKINVRHGKGGSNGVVTCMPDKYLAKRLERIKSHKGGGDGLFYSAETMKHKAVEMGIECHDLRRVAAITHRNRNIKNVGVYKANGEVKDFLRHKRFSTTKRYLFNKKLFLHK